MSERPEPTTARRSTPARSLPIVVARFLRTETSGGILLLVATAGALVWANSPWHHGYESLWNTRVVLRVGSLEFDEDLRHFVNDALMALFFFVVGLEIKRELVRGELADARVALLPVLASIGGMVVPAALYLAVAKGSAGGHGWGIPMATDIAFAVGVLALVGSRVPSSLKLFLLTLAVVDDVGAIGVIAIFYSGDIKAWPLLGAAAGIGASILLRRLRVDWPPLYVALAIATWYATYRSGVHATIAGVALGLATPARPIAPAATVRRWAQDLSDEPEASEVRQMTIIARESVSAAEHMEELLHPATTFVVLPVFALANAGIELQSGMLSGAGAERVFAGVMIGLVGGKLIGILAGAWLGVRFGGAALPPDTRWPHIAGVAALGGIGFTVSLFVAGLAFTSAELTDAAKIGVLVASAMAAAIGAGILLLTRAPESDDGNLMRSD